MTSKELEALNRIKKIEIYKEEDYYDTDDERTIGLSGYEYQGNVEEEYANEIDLIETTLNENQERIKELERINKNLVLENRLLNQIDKKRELKLKALEIIKEILPIEEEDFFYDEETDTYFFIGHKVSKEKYDFLKEVLL